jgi:hypothetical protein
MTQTYHCANITHSPRVIQVDSVEQKDQLKFFGESPRCPICGTVMTFGIWSKSVPKETFKGFSIFQDYCSAIKNF